MSENKLRTLLQGVVHGDNQGNEIEKVLDLAGKQGKVLPEDFPEDYSEERFVEAREKAQSVLKVTGGDDWSVPILLFTNEKTARLAAFVRICQEVKNNERSDNESVIKIVSDEIDPKNLIIEFSEKIISTRTEEAKELNLFTLAKEELKQKLIHGTDDPEKREKLCEMFELISNEDPEKVLIHGQDFFDALTPELCKQFETVLLAK